jgi:hypothetical protein
LERISSWWRPIYLQAERRQFTAVLQRRIMLNEYNLKNFGTYKLVYMSHATTNWFKGFWCPIIFFLATTPRWNTSVKWGNIDKVNCIRKKVWEEERMHSHRERQRERETDIYTWLEIRIEQKIQWPPTFAVLSLVCIFFNTTCLFKLLTWYHMNHQIYVAPASWHIHNKFNMIYYAFSRLHFSSHIQVCSFILAY